jgi:large subunit ribosomal protein L35
MPKMKTHSGAKKRFKVTGTGKIIHKKANRGHIMEKKSSKRARFLAAPSELVASDAKKAKKLLGI